MVSDRKILLSLGPIELIFVWNSYTVSPYSSVTSTRTTTSYISTLPSFEMTT